MEIENYKKTIGWGLIALFTVFFINVLVACIPVMHDSAFYKIRDWWFILSQIIQASAVILIAFSRNSQASLISKIGAILYSLLMLMYITNRIVFFINGNAFLYFQGVSEYVNSLLLYSPGLLLLVWGLSKLWLPIKLVTTLSVIVSIIEDMIWARLVPMNQNMSDYSFEQTEPLQNIVDILSHINSFITFALIVLTFVWMCLRSKVPSVQNRNIEII
ncbi:MAG: hypothetical protein SPE17_00955 [Alloprevotella sp.]|nr:hypothetical protein [Alloprevotella sp.]